MFTSFIALLVASAELVAPGLSSPSWREREQAYTKLGCLLPASEGVLRHLSAYGDPEAVRRSNMLLARLQAQRDAVWAKTALSPERMTRLPWLDNYSLAEHMNNGWQLNGFNDPLTAAEERKRQAAFERTVHVKDTFTDDYTRWREGARLYLLNESPSNARWLVSRWREVEREYRKNHQMPPAPWEGTQP